MDYYLDSEFDADDKRIISLALVSEDDRELYLLNSEARAALSSPWVQENVHPYLPPRREELTIKGTTYMVPDRRWMPLGQFRYEILRFTGEDESPRFIGDYCDHDWVMFCDLFGGMMDLPHHYPMLCLDFRQWVIDAGNPELPSYVEMGFREHDALEDAKALKYRHHWLMKQKSKKTQEQIKSKPIPIQQEVDRFVSTIIDTLCIATADALMPMGFRGYTPILTIYLYRTLASPIEEDRYNLVVLEYRDGVRSSYAVRSQIVPFAMDYGAIQIYQNLQDNYHATFVRVHDLFQIRHQIPIDNADVKGLCLET